MQGTQALWLHEGLKFESVHLKDMFEANVDSDEFGTAAELLW
jgi:hypothetical protein